MIPAMKTRGVKTKIKQLVKRYGSRKKVAVLLTIDLSYIYKLEKGVAPGWRLYNDICRFAK
jgi:hypothetical protein